MVNIIKESSSFVIQGDVNSFPFKDGKISLPLNSLYFVIDESNVISFKQVNDNNTLLSVNINNLQINGEEVTKENLIEKFDAVANGSMGGTKLNAGTNITLQPQEDGSITISATGELGGTVAWADVTEKPDTFTPSAHTHLSADITDLQGKLDAKQDTLVSGTNIKTINGQDILGSGDIEIQGGTGDVTQQYVDEQLALKVDKTAYEADKETFALKTEIPSIEGLASKEELQNGLDGKQDKGDYALKSELSGKQDTLVSGTNIKTVNGQTLLGEGNIEIQGGGSGISDAPSDDKLYGRKNANWSEIIIPSTDNLATKEELAGKANTSDLSNYLQTSVAESTYAKKSEIPEEYTLPIATAEALGGIKVGAGLSINPGTGVLSATGGGTADSVDWANITSKPETFTPSAHNHPISEVTDLQDKLDAKADKTAIADMATKTWVGEQGYLTAVPEEYVTETELSGKGYLTAIPEEYVTNEELTSALSSKQDKGNYITVETADGKYQVKGDYATTAQLANKVDTSAYTEDKATFATKEELAGKANTSDLSNYLTTSNAETIYAKKSEIPSLEGYLKASTADEKYATKTELSGKADKTAIADMLTKTEAASTYQPKGEYLTSVPAEYITESELNAKGYKKIEYLTQTQYDELPTKEEGVMYVITDAPEVVIPDTSTFATKEEIADMATKTWVGEQGFLTSHQDISNLATKQEVTEGLATKQDKGNYITVETADGKYQVKGDYATKAELADKANTSDLSNYLQTSVAESTYAKKSEIPSLEGYLQTSVADEKYATKTELEGKVDDADIADMLTKTEAASTYQPKGEYATTSQLTSKQDKLVSGTNIKTVNGNSLLGSGNIVIEGGSSSGNDVQEVAGITNVSIASVIENAIYIDTNTIEDVPETYAAEVAAPIAYGNIYIGNEGKLLKVYDKDTLTKTEASTTYALQSALQAALERITALEGQIGTLSAKLDEINGEVID